jgi:membrane protein DedA with SNARE-associated domain
MLQDIISYISTLDPSIIYLVLFFFAFIENIIPPSPSDVVVVIGSTLIAQTAIGFIPILAVTTIGSAIGFVVMYYFGGYFGEKIIRKGRFKFIKPEALHKTDEWFNKYGYNLILINRFMPGTRAVISFFCGVHQLKPLKTFFFASISSLVWNALLITLGIGVGNNIDLIDKYLNTYSNIVWILTIIIAAYLIYRFVIKKKKN